MKPERHESCRIYDPGELDQKLALGVKWLVCWPVAARHLTSTNGEKRRKKRRDVKPEGHESCRIYDPGKLDQELTPEARWLQGTPVADRYLTSINKKKSE